MEDNGNIVVNVSNSQDGGDPLAGLKAVADDLKKNLGDLADAVCELEGVVKSELLNDVGIAVQQVIILDQELITIRDELKKFLKLPGGGEQGTTIINNYYGSSGGNDGDGGNGYNSGGNDGDGNGKDSEEFKTFVEELEKTTKFAEDIHGDVKKLKIAWEMYQKYKAGDLEGTEAAYNAFNKEVFGDMVEDTLTDVVEDFFGEIVGDVVEIFVGALLEGTPVGWIILGTAAAGVAIYEIAKNSGGDDATSGNNGQPGFIQESGDQSNIGQNNGTPKTTANSQESLPDIKFGLTERYDENNVLPATNMPDSPQWFFGSPKPKDKQQNSLAPILYYDQNTGAPVWYNMGLPPGTPGYAPDGLSGPELTEHLRKLAGDLLYTPPGDSIPHSFGNSLDIQNRVADGLKQDEIGEYSMKSWKNGTAGMSPGANQDNWQAQAQVRGGSYPFSSSYIGPPMTMDPPLGWKPGEPYTPVAHFMSEPQKQAPHFQDFLSKIKQHHQSKCVTINVNIRTNADIHNNTFHCAGVTSKEIESKILEVLTNSISDSKVSASTH